MLNRKGEVIGILTANLGSAQDIALCIPISAALNLVKGELGSLGAASLPAAPGKRGYSLSRATIRKQGRPTFPDF